MYLQTDSTPVQEHRYRAEGIVPIMLNTHIHEASHHQRHKFRQELTDSSLMMDTCTHTHTHTH